MSYSKSVEVKNRFYFPELDGLRFFAFFLVLIHHMEDPLYFFGEGASVYRFFSAIRDFGWIGVDLFLVLSSYLITLILLEERKKTNDIGVIKFYIRRALRIWPLYLPYILVIFTLLYLFVPKYSQVFQQHGVWFFLFLGNFSYAAFPQTLNSLFSHLWTISLEEQFYAFIPLFIKKFYARSQTVLAMCAIAIMGGGRY